MDPAAAAAAAAAYYSSNPAAAASYYNPYPGYQYNYTTQQWEAVPTAGGASTSTSAPQSSG